MILAPIRKSYLYARFLLGLKIFLPWYLVNSNFLRHLHFRGWFSTTVQEKRIELFNFNTQLETSLFWTKSTYELDLSLMCFAELAKIATHILDVGANTGIFAIAAASANESARVFAIEPNYSNFTALKANVKRNNLTIICLNVAATNQTRLVTLWDFPTEISYSASLEKEFRDGQGAIPNEVLGIKLDQILIDATPSSLLLAKIDVESHEAEVIRGMSVALANNHSQIIYVVEIIRAKVAIELMSILPSDKFAYFNINDKSKMIGQMPNLCVIDGGMNYLIVSLNILDKVTAHLRGSTIIANLQYL